MADDHAGLHKDPVTGEMISKKYVPSSTFFVIDIDMIPPYHQRAQAPSKAKSERVHQGRKDTRSDNCECKRRKGERG